MKKFLLFFFYFILCIFQANCFATVSSNSLEKILFQYCVPKEGNCDVKATYKNGKCICPGDKLYMDRECFKPVCPSGTYIYYSNDTDSCGAGNYRTKVRN